MEVGHELIVITWLHEARRDVLTGYPRSDESRPLTGVFYTHSPARPNPLGLHPVTVLEIDGTRVKIGPIEVFDGTPVVDISIDGQTIDGIEWRRQRCVRGQFLQPNVLSVMQGGRSPAAAWQNVRQKS